MERPITIRNEINEVLTLIEIAMDKAREEAISMGIDVMELRTSDGRWVMHGLLATKVQATHSLLLLDLVEQGKA
jgi:hypothetical protein